MRKIAGFLFLIMLVSVFTSACGTPEKEVFDVDFTGSTGPVDLEGANIVYKVYIPSDQSADTICLGYEIDTVFADMAAQRLKDVESNLNCNFEMIYDTGSAGEYFTAAVSGTFVSDVVMGVSDIWADIARTGGMLIGLSELGDYIDYRNEEKWGYSNMLEVVAFEDDVYGVTPLYWPDVSVYVRTPIVVNENLIASLGETDPRDYIENKQWTWDVFEECLGRYYVEESGEVKHYSITSGFGDFGSMFALSNGNSYFVKNSSGKYISGLYTPETMKAMQRCVEILSGPNSHTINSTGNAVDSLISGTTVMGALKSTEIIGVGGRIAREMDNYGILSWPHGPDVEPGYIFGYYSNIQNCIAFSRASNNPEAAAKAIDALYEPFDEYPTMDSVIDFMSKAYFFDERDSQVYYQMYFNSSYNYFHYGMSNILSDWANQSKSVSEYLESNEGSISEFIEEYVAPAKRGLDAIFGSK